MQSLKLGKIFGINVELHLTFLILIAAVAILLLIIAPNAFVGSLILLFLLFLSVFVHEMCHSVVSNRLGYKIKKIMLHPLGGVALSEKLPTKPSHEFIISIVGALFNFAVVAVVLVINSYTVLFPPLSELIKSAEALNSALVTYPWFALFYVNLILGAFNLFTPALPLDGGRVLRSLLAMKFPFETATRITTKVSTFIAIFLGILGFFGNPVLLIIAFFIYFGSSWEYQDIIMRSVMKDVKLEKCINRKPKLISSEKSLDYALRLMKKENRLSLLAKIGKNYAMLTVDSFANIPKKDWKKAKIKNIAKRLPFVSINSKTEDIFTEMTSKDYAFLPVKSKGRFVGIIELSRLQKLFELLQAEKSVK